MSESNFGSEFDEIMQDETQLEAAIPINMTPEVEKWLSEFEELESYKERIEELKKINSEIENKMTPSLVIQYISGINICLKNKDNEHKKFNKIIKHFLEDYPKKALQFSNMGQKQFD